jgi:hypothetical protein
MTIGTGEATAPKHKLKPPRPPYLASCSGPGNPVCCDPDGCRELGCVRQFERLGEVCDRCGIRIRPEGGHLCGSCGRDI